MPHVATLQKTVGAVPTNITTIWSLIGLRKHQNQWLLELTALRVVAFLALVAVFGSLVAVVAIPLALIVGVPALLFGVPIFLFVGLPLFLFVGLPFLCIVGVPLGVVAACALLAAVVGLISLKAFALPLPLSRGQFAWPLYVGRLDRLRSRSNLRCCAGSWACPAIGVRDHIRFDASSAL